MMSQWFKNPPANARDPREAGAIPASGRPPGEGNGNPLQYSCLENPIDRGAWWATVHGVTKSPTRLRDSARVHGELSSSQMFFYYVQKKKKRPKGYFLHTGHTVYYQPKFQYLLIFYEPQQKTKTPAYNPCSKQHSTPSLCCQRTCAPERGPNSGAPGGRQALASTRLGVQLWARPAPLPPQPQTSVVRTDGAGVPVHPPTPPHPPVCLRVAGPPGLQ